MRTWLALLLVALFGCAGAFGRMAQKAEILPAASATSPLRDPRPCGHAHNDYRHARPLLDALEHGFCSVEADVWLVDGELRVGHDRDETVPGRTLTSLYLEPLAAWTRRHGGRILPDRDDFELLVDVKSDATDTWVALDAAHARYGALLTTWRDGVATAGPVTVIVSGNRDRSAIAEQPLRRAAVDGRLGDLVVSEGASLVPLVSDSALGMGLLWNGRGPVPAAAVALMKAYADRAHLRGERLRIYGWPADNGEAWRAQLRAGVDRINTDDLEGLARLLASR